MIPDVVLLCSLEVIVAYMLVVYSFFFNLLVSCLGSLQLFPWAVHGSEAGKSIEHLWIHHVLCLHTWWFTLCVCARQLCGVYTALAEDIQGYAMSFGSNLGAPSLSRWPSAVTGLALASAADTFPFFEIMYIVFPRPKLQGEWELVKLVDQACQGRSHPGHSQGA